MDIEKIIAELTLEEKASLCSGGDFWHTKAVKRLGIPDIMVSDGPHGLRKQDLKADHLGINESIKAVCFPSGAALAASFDRELAGLLGETLGEECAAEDVSVILGPAVNIKRSPLCGRNFEYYSEDPYLAGEMAAGYINGVQSRHVGTSIKHFLVNSQEHRRMSSSSEADERTLREIYMPAFETAVKKAKPWTVMCSYNRINGEYASENRHYLTEVLRNEWGFDGVVVSDWGAVNDRAKGVASGLDLEMPSSNGINDQKIIEAVKNGGLSEEALNKAVENVLRLIEKSAANGHQEREWDKEAHHRISEKICEESMVLLKSDGILPLAEGAKVAFIGEFAEKPRFQGGGSSHINVFRKVSACEAAKDMDNVTYARGYDTAKDVTDPELVREAVNAAAAADTAVIFAGLPDSFESEGYDRSHMRMPDSQNALIEAVLKVQPNTVIVLHNGSPVEMPWADRVRGILEVYLGGQAVGEAEVRALFGMVNPSGRLAETFPLRLEDNPSYLFYRGEGDKVEYREGVFVGYRYYDKKKIPVRFPFGYGLSYTTFTYGELKLDKTKMQDMEELHVSLPVTNTGTRAGKEVVQLYVLPAAGEVIRPEKELKGFAKVALEPGETKTVEFTLGKRAFAFYDTEIGGWRTESGTYRIAAAKSAAEICCTASVEVTGEPAKRPVFTENSTFGDCLATPEGREILTALAGPMAALLGEPKDDAEDVGAVSRQMQQAMVNYMPLRGLISFGTGEVTHETLQEILKRMNHA